MNTELIRAAKPIDVSPSSQAWYTDKLNQSLDEYDDLQADNKRLRAFITKLKEKSQFAHIPNYVLRRECEQVLKEKGKMWKKSSLRMF